MKKKAKTFRRQLIQKYKKTEEYRVWCRWNLKYLLESLPPTKNNTHLKQLKKQAKKAAIQGFLLKTTYLPQMKAALKRDQSIYEMLNRNHS